MHSSLSVRTAAEAAPTAYWGLKAPAPTGVVHLGGRCRPKREAREVDACLCASPWPPDAARCDGLRVAHGGLLADFSRQRLDAEALAALERFYEAREVAGSVADMLGGEKVNGTEGRAALHAALRAAPSDSYKDAAGGDAGAEARAVLDKIEAFAGRVRGGELVGATGKKLTSVVAIGIGGSYLGPAFVHTALATEPRCAEAAQGRELRFLANVDPVDCAKALKGLDPETTLAIVVSKTFTTAETMLNARTVRDWVVRALGEEAVRSHMIAVSTNLDAVRAFGIAEENAFAFWDWVGGRFSVCSAVGALPLALHYGMGVVRDFLAGARDMDRHFAETACSPRRSLPVMMGMVAFWNHAVCGLPARAVLPYSQALEKFPAHVQQLSMESLGKGVTTQGGELLAQGATGEVIFGEPGTNGQHSFYQLMHQGRVVPADFIGACESQNPVRLEGETVSSHDELMSNFFAQPDALALGKTAEQVRAEGVADALVAHKVFEGGRPSTMLLMPRVDPFNVGQLLALYEHQTAVEGFLLGVNTFDQWGVELGKALAKQVRAQLKGSRDEGKAVAGFAHSTAKLMEHYLIKTRK